MRLQAVLHTVLQGRTSQKYPGGQTSHSSLAVRLVLRVRVRVRVRVSVRVRVRVRVRGAPYSPIGIPYLPRSCGQWCGILGLRCTRG